MSVAKGLHAEAPWRLDRPLLAHDVLPPLAAAELV